MSVKQVFDHSLRTYGKRFISSLKASNRYSGGYLGSLETTVAMAALYAEEQGWPDVPDIITEHIEDYLAYIQDRVRWFGERTYTEPGKLSKGHINAQYRRLNRFFNWLVERKHIGENPLDDIEPPSLDEKTVPTVSECQMRDLLTLPLLEHPPAVSGWFATGQSCTLSGTRGAGSPKSPSCSLTTWTLPTASCW